MENLILVHSADVCHHGVKGQSWGKRQYQYEDGSLTPLGRDHYGVSKREFGKKEQQAFLNKKGRLTKQGEEHYTKKLSDTVKKEQEARKNYKNAQDNAFSKAFVSSLAGGLIGLRVGGVHGAYAGSIIGSAASAIKTYGKMGVNSHRMRKARKENNRAAKILSEFSNLNVQDINTGAKYSDKNKK